MRIRTLLLAAVVVLVLRPWSLTFAAQGADACPAERLTALLQDAVRVNPEVARARKPMKRIAAPMVGGLFRSFLMELLIYPAIHLLWRWHSHVMRTATTAVAMT